MTTLKLDGVNSKLFQEIGSAHFHYFELDTRNNRRSVEGIENLDKTHRQHGNIKATCKNFKISSVK